MFCLSPNYGNNLSFNYHKPCFNPYASFMHQKLSSRFFRLLCPLCLSFLLAAPTVKAQADSSHLKTNVDKDSFLNPFEAFKTSRNISGLADVADHHHYPSPEKVLGWQKQLQLNDRQKAVINQINTALQRKVKEMNGFLITNEKMLDSLFNYKKVNNGLLIYYTNRYGLYQGELRNAILQACLKTETQLTATQLKKYGLLLQD